MAQAFHGEAVDVADAGVGEVVDSRFVGVDDAVTVGDGDGVACDLVDGLQPILELACELLRLLVACLAAQDGEGSVLDARDGRVLARVAAQDAASSRTSTRRNEESYESWMCSSKRLSSRINA